MFFDSEGLGTALHLRYKCVTDLGDVRRFIRVTLFVIASYLFFRFRGFAHHVMRYIRVANNVNMLLFSLIYTKFIIDTERISFS